MSVIDDVKKHQKFVSEVKDYINECLENDVSPNIILDSFKRFIDDVIEEKIKEAKK